MLSTTSPTFSTSPDESNLLVSLSEILNLSQPLRLEWLLLFASVLGYFWIAVSDHRRQPRVPLVGVGSMLTPRFVGIWKFFKDAGKVIDEGYSKSQTKAFKIVRNYADMVIILPRSSVEEISALPREVANTSPALIQSLIGRYTGLEFILNIDLHMQMIQTKLTPNLGYLTKPMEDEVKWAAVHASLGDEGKWTKFNPFHEILEIVASTGARVLIGLPLSRDRRWLEASVQFTENAWLLPSNYRSARFMRQAAKLLVPEIERRRMFMPQGKLDEVTSRTLLSWMIQYAKDADKDASRLAQLQVLVAFGAIHTTQTTIVQVLYDLAARPEYIEELREEIQKEVAAKQGHWDKASYTRLWKMDSFMKESQRFNPPNVLSLQRVMMRSYDMSDGTHLPMGAHLAMPVQAIQNDPAITEDPEVFDGLRYYRLRQEPNQANRHQFATTEKTQLHFGYGRAACPGRFFASLAIKMILVHLIMNYDFKLVGENRPGNLTAYEFVFPDPKGELFIRKRAEPESPL